MILCDVGVLLHALFEQSEHHDRCLAAIEAFPEDEAFAYSEVVLAAVVRIGTNPRVYAPAPSADDVFGFLDAVRERPGSVRIEAGEGHWQIFRDLVVSARVRGPDVTDAYLAAVAIEHGCEWWTTDRGFARFPGLRWRNLLGDANTAANRR